MDYFTLNLLFNAVGFALQDRKVGIYVLDEDNNEVREVLKGNIVFDTAIINADVARTSSITTQPIETNVRIADHKIIRPIEIQATIALPSLMYSSIVRELESYFINSTKLIVVTQDRQYRNMILYDMPHEENSRNVGRLTYRLSFMEVLVVEPDYLNLSRVLNATDADTQSRGVINGVPVNIGSLENPLAIPA